MKENLLILFCILLIKSNTYSQLNIFQRATIKELTQELVGKGIEVSNITFNGEVIEASSLASNFNDKVNDTNKGFGITEGIILSTIPGNFISRSGTNTPVIEFHPNAPTSAFLLGKEPDLELIAQKSSPNFNGLKDASILEFDFVPTANEIEVNFVFASDEYPDHVCSTFNDVFGFFISGPGINGPYANNAKNIALIPNTAIEIAINTINNGFPGTSDSSGCELSNGTSGLDHSQYFVSNLLMNSSVSDMLFQGFTVPILAKSAVQCGKKYHIKLAIADVNDGQMNSAIFLEKESLKSVEDNLSINILADSNTTAEGCKNLVLNLERIHTTQDLKIFFQTTGNAQNGIDYFGIPDSIVVPKGTKSINVIVDILSDDILDDMENAMIKAYAVINACNTSTIKDSVQFIIKDVKPLVLKDQSTCLAGSVQLEVNDGDSFQWIPAEGLDNATIPNPIASPNTTTKYTITTNYNNSFCSKAGTVTVEIKELEVDAGPDISICKGDTVNLISTGDGSIFKWEPQDFLTTPNQSLTLAYPTKNITYKITAIDTSGKCVGGDSIKISIDNISPNFEANLVCLRNATSFKNLTANINNTKWLWTFGDGKISNEKEPNHVYKEAGFYNVNLNAIAGACQKEISKKVEVFDIPTANFKINKEILSSYDPVVNCIDLSKGSTNGVWSFGDGIKEPHILGEVKNHTYPYSKYIDEYSISLIISNDNNCIDSAKVNVEIKNEWDMYFPNSFSPNGDGLNDDFIGKGFGVNRFRLKIYNRWGELLFETSNLNQGWNGRSKNGSMADGIYVWSAEVTFNSGNMEKFFGQVNLVK